MKCINSKKNIVKIVANNNDLIVQEKNHLYINDLKVDIQEDDYIGVSYGNIIKTNSDKKEVSIWNNTDFSLLSKKHSSLNFTNSSLFVLVDFDYENVYSLYKVKVNDNIYNVKIEGFKNIIHFDSEKIWVNDMFENNIIDCISINNENLWSYSLPEGFKIFGAPEIIDNVVYILAYTSHFQESHRIGLEIETGNKIWEISGGVDKNTTPIHAKTFNPKDKLLYGLYKTFQVFNPKTGELLVNKIIEKANEDHFDAYSKAIYDDKLWFVSGKYENCKFGYISLKTNEIEFLQDFPQENDEIFDTPIFHQNKLYLRGKYYNNLYIFEE